MEELSDKRALVCNYREGISPVSKGSRAYVLLLPGDPERVWLLVRSRGGRYIQKWERTRRLMNVRIVTVPPTHPLYERIAPYTKDMDAYLEAERQAMEFAIARSQV